MKRPIRWVNCLFRSDATNSACGIGASRRAYPRLEARNAPLKLRNFVGSNAGYALLVLLITVTVILLTLTAALPSAYQEGQREREEELIFRGNEYARAIFLFQRQFHRYPVSVDELIRTNGMRFLRHAYTDPMSPNGKWRFIHVGPNGVLLDSRTQKVQLGPNPMALGGPDQTGNGAESGGFGLAGGAQLNAQLGSAGQGTLGLSLGASAGTSSPGQTGTVVSGDNNRRQSTNTTGNTGEQSEKRRPSPDCLGAKSDRPQSTSAFGGFALSNQPVGTAIAGVASCSEHESIRVWNRYNHYADWEFLGTVYTPFTGQQSPHASPGAGGATGQPSNPNQPTQPGSMQPAPDQPMPTQPSPDQPVAPNQPNPNQPSQQIPLQPISPGQSGVSNH